MERKTSDEHQRPFHLADDQWVECLLGEPPADVVAHLNICSACRDELQRFRTVTEQLAQQSRAYTEALPEQFWQEQRRGIAASLAARGKERKRENFSRRFAFGFSVAAVLFLAIFLMRWPPPAGSPPVTQSSWSEDDVLLSQVQEALNREEPAALAPVALLTDEMERGISQNPVR